MPQDGTAGGGKGGEQSGGASDEFNNPLPAGSSESPIGPASRWPETLKAFSLTIASFPYPSAIFYGDELHSFYNQHWADTVGGEEQGQKQRGKLGADAWDALSSTLRGKKPKRVEAKQLLRSSGDSAGGYRHALLSPLFHHQDVVGVLAQLVPQENAGNASSSDDTNGSETAGSGESKSTEPRPAHKLDVSELGNVGDEFPLDEHPFFHRFAEMLPSGLAILDHRAQAVFVNQLFYDLTTHQNEDQAFKSWPQSIHPDDYDRVMNAYQDAFNSQQQLRTEFRAVEKEKPWRLLLLTPLGDENLRHVSLREYGGFICSIVDISSEKERELSERSAANEARERKEQQERFIDMISHEIRNPLSAILHCTEDIADAINKPQGETDVDSIREAVDTVELCISHQRNIVNDVLSFSKLDASMLSLAPRPSKPSEQLATTMKMFHPEFRKQSMEYGFCIDPSYVEHNITAVMADLPRMGQVLVNLISNAIKFTAKSEKEKKITVSVGASADRPTSYPPNVVYFNSDDLTYRMDATEKSAWGSGQVVYIMVAVKDSGIGIDEEGQRQLFERFRQATPKTAELYGGSGLGLNISRKLCHLHGGEIGVSSQEGNGSTFGFFFKVKRAKGNEETETQVDGDFTGAEEVKDEAEALGNLTLSDGEADGDIPESISSPPVQKADETTPYPDGSKDQRYQQTAAVASGVKEHGEADTYANSARPRISEQHIQGSHYKSAELTSTEKNTHSAPDSERPKTHVLIVEDNVINQRILFRKLDKKGYNVTTANNGQEAVDAIRKAPSASSGDKNAFTIALMDQEMPVLDGNSATKKIRSLEKDGEIEHIQILGLTANVRDAQQQEMINSGMDDVITKPYKIEDLVNKIESMTHAKPTCKK